jgi:hypothetical protein
MEYVVAYASVQVLLRASVLSGSAADIARHASARIQGKCTVVYLYNVLTLH